MNSREKLFDFILSLTDEEAKEIAAYLRDNQHNLDCGGKETNAEKKKIHR